MTSKAAPPYIHPLEGFLGYQLRRASTFMQADLAKRTVDIDLTMVEMSALFVIEANPLITQSEIGRMLSIKRPNMAPLTAVLLARELIEKSPVDGRSHGLTLSAKGCQAVAEAHVRVDENEARLFERIPESERARFTQLLRLVWNKRE